MVTHLLETLATVTYHQVGIGWPSAPHHIRHIGYMRLNIVMPPIIPIRGFVVFGAIVGGQLCWNVGTCETASTTVRLHYKFIPPIVLSHSGLPHVPSCSLLNILVSP